MKCVVSVPDPNLVREAADMGADIVEVRLDLTGPVPPEMARRTLTDIPVPLLLTLRSAEEGGEFRGSREDWWALLEPLLPFFTFVDVEQQFAVHAPCLREAGKIVVSSLHTPSMPSRDELRASIVRLRNYGDIPKIAVKPSGKDDALALLSFTLHEEKPVVVSIMGAQFRFVRLMLPLFGSEFFFCHAGTSTSPGQYHIREWKEFIRMVEGG
ncbi:MAG: type I 3-dehydroquinate dehydratase [Methanolinea sp.]|nr:type I 3-dehydroquinate dehydratase [Methanolinea sp.]